MNTPRLFSSEAWRFGPDWPGRRCGAKTRRGTPCQKPSLKGNARCQLHGGRGGAPSGRSFATRLAEKGVSVFVLKELMGHSSIQTTSGYVHAGEHQQWNAVGLI